jgi:magnesium transporter
MDTTPQDAAPTAPPLPSLRDETLTKLSTYDPPSAAELLERESDETALVLLSQLNPESAREIVPYLTDSKRRRLLEIAPLNLRGQWLLNDSYPENSIGRLMLPPIGVLHEATEIPDAIAVIRRLSGRHSITYLYIVNDHKRLVGVAVLKDIFLAEPSQRLADVMIPSPFYLTPELSVLDAMKVVVSRHYPSYPVCDANGKVIGLIRGERLFEKQAIVISAQAGTMVGVKAAERLTTPWTRSFTSRHAWLQLNLIATFATAAVITLFQETLGQLIILAAFLPLISGQSRNSGAQTMAITLRSMNLGEWPGNGARKVIGKEMLLALVNGALVGLVAFAIIWTYAHTQHDPNAWPLAWLVFAALLFSGLFSGLFGVLIPMGLRRLGLDPALAATILHSTATTIIAQLIVLLLAKWWLTHTIL